MAATDATSAPPTPASFPDELIIRCVKQHACLYDPRESDYKDADRKANVWRRIASDVGLSAVECEHRWRYLRDRYTRERKRKSQQTATNGGKSNGANWPLAAQMHFIQDFIKHRSFKLKARRGGRQNIDRHQEVKREIKVESEASRLASTSGDETTDGQASLGGDFTDANVEYPMVIIEESDHQHELVDHGPATPASDFRTAPRSAYCSNNNSYNNGLESATSYNEDELFCLSIAQTLRRLPLMRRSLAKVQILQLVHDIEFGHS